MVGSVCSNQPSPAGRERVANASEPGEGGRAGLNASGISGALTLTRFASLTTLSRPAGEGYWGAA